MTVNTDRKEKNSIYRGRIEFPSRGSWAPIFLLIASLISAHFLNLILQWTVIRNELAQKPSYHTPEYSFLGFSLLNGEKIAAAQRLPNASPAGRVFAFFDPIHPAVFMVWNNGKDGDFFDLGPVVAALPAGASRVSLFPGTVFLLRQGKKAVARDFGGSILGRAWARFLNGKMMTGKAGEGQFSGSFVTKQPEASPHLKFPYLIYFYLPLALIIIAIATSEAAMATAFFYYIGMFFLFDFEKLFVTVPLAWFFNILNIIDLPDPFIKALSMAMALLFLAAAVYGLWRWKSREMSSRGKWIVWFFILLPFFLFF